MPLRRDTTTIGATMIGMETMPLMTALQNNTLIG
jgi:hypothetical protein